MTAVVMAASLPPARRQLVKRMQALNFGRIEGLSVRNGEPVLAPPPRIIREVKFGGQNGPRPESVSADFAIKTEVLELFEQITAMRQGVIACIEVRHGLPFRMITEDDAQVRG